jgi:hypothetical protein
MISAKIETEDCPLSHLIEKQLIRKSKELTTLVIKSSTILRLIRYKTGRHSIIRTIQNPRIPPKEIRDADAKHFSHTTAR